MLKWVKLDNAQKFHCFDLTDGRSLCQGWMASIRVIRSGEEASPADLQPSHDSCARCRKLLASRLTDDK